MDVYKYFVACLYITQSPQFIEFAEPIFIKQAKIMILIFVLHICCINIFIITFIL